MQLSGRSCSLSGCLGGGHSLGRGAAQGCPRGAVCLGGSESMGLGRRSCARRGRRKLGAGAEAGTPMLAHRDKAINGMHGYGECSSDRHIPAAQARDSKEEAQTQQFKLMILAWW
jgi:hypothetical protein